MTELEKLKEKYRLLKELVADGMATEADLERVKKQIDDYVAKLFAE